MARLVWHLLAFAKHLMAPSVAGLPTPPPVFSGSKPTLLAAFSFQVSTRTEDKGKSNVAPLSYRAEELGAESTILEKSGTRGHLVYETGVQANFDCNSPGPQYPSVFLMLGRMFSTEYFHMLTIGRRCFIYCQLSSKLPPFPGNDN